MFQQKIYPFQFWPMPIPSRKNNLIIDRSYLLPTQILKKNLCQRESKLINKNLTELQVIRYWSPYHYTQTKKLRRELRKIIFSHPCRLSA